MAFPLTITKACPILKVAPRGLTVTIKYQGVLKGSGLKVHTSG